MDGPIPCIKQLINVFNDVQSSVITVNRVDWSEVGQYGIIGTEDNESNLFVVNTLEKLQSSPSNLAIMGRYIYWNRSFDILEHTKAGCGGEIQLTDALSELAELKP